MRPLLYRDITKPHLWPTETLTEARKECRYHLNYHLTKPEYAAISTTLLAAIDAVLLKRKITPRPC